MKRTSRATRWLGTATVLSLSVGLYMGTLTGVAHGDYAPSAGDVVGVGGQTPQYNLDFAADGDTAGDLGFNASGNFYKLVDFDATADSNGRDAYADGSSLASPVPLNPTIVLRAGTHPVQRPSTSGAGISALLADTGATEQINFARSASEPTAANQTTAASNGWTFLHVVQIGTDPEEIVADKTTNAPAGLSINDLLNIYDGAWTTWGQVPSYAGPAPTATIVPLIPPSTSSITKTFLADLKTANGGTAPTLKGVSTVEQNDPTAITNLPGSQSANAIVPFSNGRLNLYNSGYFFNPANPFPISANTVETSGIVALTGNDPGGTAAYTDTNLLLVIFRQSDATSATAWQPGSSLNWAQTLFSDPGGPKPFFAGAAGQALVAAAGGVPGYKDLGDVSSG